MADGIWVYALARPDGSTLHHAYFTRRHAEASMPSWASALGEDLHVVSWPVEEDSMVIVDDTGEGQQHGLWTATDDEP